jgi:hypothetical protein
MNVLFVIIESLSQYFVLGFVVIAQQFPDLTTNSKFSLTCLNKTRVKDIDFHHKDQEGKFQNRL